MITEASTKQEIIGALDETVASVINMMSSLTDEQVNKIPYEDSWTAGQLLRHVSKSMAGIGTAIAAKGDHADRDIRARIPELKNTFLDFSIKMKSPDFIVPEKGPYSKSSSISELRNALGTVQEAAQSADLGEMATGLPVGPITKLELLHFILYHTQRHEHQMQHICDALNK